MKNKSASFVRILVRSVSVAGAITAIVGALQGCNSDQVESQSGLAPISRSVQCREGTEKDPAPFVDLSQCAQAGVMVIDQNDSLYVLNRVYSDGRADVSYYDYNGGTTLAAGSYFPEVYRISGFSITDESSAVIDQSNTRYSVVRLFSNGKAQLSYRDYNGKKVSDIRGLAVSVPSFGNVKVGDQIMDANNTHYVVEEIYSDGRIHASYRDYNGRTFLKRSDVVVAI